MEFKFLAKIEISSIRLPILILLLKFPDAISAVTSLISFIGLNALSINILRKKNPTIFITKTKISITIYSCNRV